MQSAFEKQAAATDITPNVAKALEIYFRHLKTLATGFDAIPVDWNNPDWVKAKLICMYRADQYALAPEPENLSLAEQKVFMRETYAPWQALHDQNNADIRTLLDHHQWFRVSEWGPEADELAWLLVQHADEDFELQKIVLGRLESLYRTGESSPVNYAYLYDRVRVNPLNPNGIELQRYGTQGRIVGAEWVPFPIEDVVNIDRRRKEIGIIPETLAEYRQIMNGLSQPEIGLRMAPEPSP